MRVEVTVLGGHGGRPTDVVLDGPDSTPMREVAEALIETVTDHPVDAAVISLAERRQIGATALQAAPALALFLDGAALDTDLTLGESGVTHGSVISVGAPRESTLIEPGGLIEIRVVSGPDCGSVHRLGAGEATIGSDPSCAITLDDQRLPPVCVRLTVALDGEVTVHPVDEAAAVITEAFPHREQAITVDRESLDDDTAWPYGGQLLIAQTYLELEHVEPPDAAVNPSEDPGWVDYNRPPRLLPPERPTHFKLPTLPTENRRGGLPWVAMLMPIVAAVGLALLTGRMAMMSMALFSPLMMFGSWIQGRRQGKVSFRQQMATYREHKTQIEEAIAEAVVVERTARRLAAPDPASALLIASGPRARLWERRFTDPDYLTIRLGVGDLDSEVQVDDPEQLEHRRTTQQPAYDVPVTIPLAERGVVGIAGRGSLPRRIAMWSVAQLAVLQSPRDTQIYVLTDRENAEEWEWLRWLPHTRPQFGQDTVITLGHDAETCARRVAELSALLASRQSEKSSGGNKRGVRFGADVVVVLDGARRLRSLPGVVALLKQGPALGIHALCLDGDERLLPEEASAVVLETPRGLSLRQQRVTVVENVHPDLVHPRWFERAARSLAPIRDISDGDGETAIPSACRLTDVLEIEPPTATLIEQRWAISPRSTEATIGISLDGAFSIDMVRDGPHGLIAGTTGAGKSELLQSIIAALAVANRPDGMTFVLIDYKGGAAFKDCVNLPHTVGMVTDLDTHLVERALTSLGAELTRREHILADVGAKDIEDYIDIKAKRAELPPMPRQLIVIDEFASLARELPDFVTGLVNIAQRGRSLGIHLILATQRPSGVVSPEIRANTNLRIALRVTDSSESTDVIDAPDAGNIAKTTPGRAYVRLGANSLVPFQSGRVGGRRPGTSNAPAESVWLHQIRTSDLSDPIPVRPKVKVQDDAEVTDLTVLVEAIRTANDSLGLEEQHSPWLPALGVDVLLDDLLTEAPVPPAPQIPTIPYALEDLPAEQARRAAALDFSTFSHLSIVGGPRSGRSQALRTMAASIGRLTSPADVHVYGLDCGNGALLPIADLPHCGAIVQRTQQDRATRLLDRLTGEMTRRQELLAGGGYADLDEMRASVEPDERLPHIVVFLDRWEGFLGSIAELSAGKPMDQVQSFLREGASVGMHLVLSGDRQLVNARMGSLVEDKIGLRFADTGDYTLLGLRARNMPDDIPDGRAFRSDSGLELQFALIAEDPSGQAQAAALRTIGADAKQTHRDVPRAMLPFRVDVLPNRIDFDEAWAMVDPDDLAPLWALVGVGGDELTAVGFDLARTPGAIIAGPPRTGRSTALLAAAESLLRGGTQVVVAAPKPSPLRDLAGRDGVLHVFTGTEITEEDLTPYFSDPEVPVVFLVDDGELLKDVEAKGYLREILTRGSERRKGIILAGDASEVGSGFSGWQVEMKGRQGLLTAAMSVGDGELIGVRIARSSLGSQQQAGRVMARLDGGPLRTIQVPLPD